MWTRLTGFALLLLMGIFLPPDMRTILEKSETEIVLAPQHGGRIAQIYVRGRALLTDATEHDEYYGSIWWPSPQQQWVWPPPPAIDQASYEVAPVENGFILKSGDCLVTGLQLNKEYRLLSDSQLQVVYTATNVTDSDMEMAHWEVSRMPKNGRVIFPAGKAFEDKGNDQGFLFYQREADLQHLLTYDQQYFDFEIMEDALYLSGKKSKLLADGSDGWHAYLREGVAVVKVFEDTQLEALAPEQGEVEVYVSKEAPYLEMEQHSAYQLLKAGKSFRWEVNWLFIPYSETQMTAEEVAEMIRFEIEERKLNH
ncbi:DUF4380 domain-containing protein [Limibacter armeniacum]|uniref:DUF4380 domain-containing protein n=1 Tax=Limibacter armeniacum TaxID=466084 RepID=UPI002FE60447